MSRVININIDPDLLCDDALDTININVQSLKNKHQTLESSESESATTPPPPPPNSNTLVEKNVQNDTTSSSIEKQCTCDISENYVPVASNKNNMSSSYCKFSVFKNMKDLFSYLPEKIELNVFILGCSSIGSMRSWENYDVYISKNTRKYSSYAERLETKYFLPYDALETMYAASKHIYPHTAIDMIIIRKSEMKIQDDKTLRNYYRYLKSKCHCWTYINNDASANLEYFSKHNFPNYIVVGPNIIGEPAVGEKYLKHVYDWTRSNFNWNKDIPEWSVFYAMTRKLFKRNAIMFIYDGYCSPEMNRVTRITTRTPIFWIHPNPSIIQDICSEFGWDTISL